MEFTRIESSAYEKAIFKMTSCEYHVSDFLFGKTDVCKRLVFDAIGWPGGREGTWSEKDVTNRIAVLDKIEELLNRLDSLK